MQRPGEFPELTEAGLRQALEERGWRYTRQRSAVFHYLRLADNHPTAEDIFSVVRKDHPRISLATVYKALDALIDCELAAKLASPDGPARFDCRHDPHYHLRDIKTGEIRDLETPYDPHLLDKLDPRLVETLRRQGFHITDYRLELMGHFEHN